jgi:UDP-N-acetyl-D-galactosamine dehydrogenase
MNDSIKNKKIAIIGLGYVGLPLAVEFGKLYATVGFDINQSRVDELNSGKDSTLEVESDILRSVTQKSDSGSIMTKTGLQITTDNAALKDCNVFIVTVPTPTDKHHRPILTPLYKASETVGAVLKKGDIVIYESTVYPGKSIRIKIQRRLLLWL